MKVVIKFKTQLSEPRVRISDDRGRVRMTASKQHRVVEFNECIWRLEITQEDTSEYHNNEVRKLMIQLNANSKDIRLNK